MIQRSFIILDKIGAAKERSIWDQDIRSWKSFQRSDSIKGVSKTRKGYYDRQLECADQALRADDARYFVNKLPSVEMWRLFDHFKDEVCYLDIETSQYYGDITVIGLYDGFDTKILVKGVNLDYRLLEKELSRYKLLVTFNGASFDLPLISRKATLPSIPHIDLRHACAKIGLSGGLKSIERELGISRLDEVREIRGDKAIYLWNMWLSTRDERYLELLVKYNEEDIINLKPIMHHVYDKLTKQIGGIQ